MIIINNISEYDNNNNLFNIKILKSNKSKIINKFKLSNDKYINKKYINNVEIISNNNEITYNLIKKDNYYIKGNLFINNINKLEIPNFQYNNIDYEESYKEYTNTINNITIILKEYNNYLILDYILDNDDFLTYFFDNLNYFII